MNLSLNEAPQELLALITRQAPALTKTPIRYQEQNISTLEVQSMLSHLNPDMPYEDWLRVGMALHSEGYDVALWDSWSASGIKYKVGECQDKWQGFNGSGGLSLGTLVHMAQQAGYSLSQNNNLPLISNRQKHAIQILHCSALDKLPKRKYLIKGLLEKGAMSVMYGGSNSGKTFIALDLAYHIALGWQWCGKKSRKGAVVYIAAEGGLGISERLKAFKKHHDLDSYADVYVIPSNVCLCKDQSEHDALIELIKSIPNLQLIVIDTLARAMGAGDENSASDMGSFIQNCDLIRGATKAHIMILHHTGKDETRGARGHSSLKAAVDTEIQVAQNNGQITAKVTKQREGKTDYALGFTLQEYEVGKDEDGDAIISCALVRADVDEGKAPLSGQAKEAYQVLLNLMLESGFDHIPKSGMKTQRCVRLSDFKEHFKMAGISETDKPDSVRTAFNRARKTLKSKKYIAFWDDYVWLLDKTDK